MENEKTNEKKVIILNKPFLGGWLNEEGRIGHEIIDFFLTDNGKYYVYNNPWGVCPKDIWVGDSEKVNDYGLKKSNGKNTETHIAEYMVLTSGAHASIDEEDENETDSSNKDKKHKTFNILYVIKLKAKIHKKTTGKNLEKNQKEIKKIIDDEKIKYNDVPLYKIYQSDDSLYLTFEADKDSVYKVKEGKIWRFTPEKYNFQRNKGYLKEDDENCKEDYDKLNKLIEDEIKEVKDGKDCILEKVTLKRLPSDQKAKNYHAEKTFLDLIGYTDSEQAFTNLLHTLLKDNDVFKKFCEEFGDIHFPEGETFTVEREKKVEKGRMDISGESKTQNVIIENKIDSGLNGLDEIKEKDAEGNERAIHITQLYTYYHEWGKAGEKKEPLCFITAPDYRKAEIDAEIKEFDPSMNNIYKIVTYGEIAEFLKKQEIKELFKNDDLISLLYDQIVNAFRKWSYKSREDLYADLFLKATEGCKKAQ